ncbi:MAG: hypothetical protein WKG01_28980 [Kofleriaceae bacterium]
MTELVAVVEPLSLGEVQHHARGSPSQLIGEVAIHALNHGDNIA